MHIVLGIACAFSPDLHSLFICFQGKLRLIHEHNVAPIRGNPIGKLSIKLKSPPLYWADRGTQTRGTGIQPMTCNLRSPFVTNIFLLMGTATIYAWRKRGGHFSIPLGYNRSKYFSSWAIQLDQLDDRHCLFP
ncbi:hypothetical protein CDAR_411801 [Caerostris darwini]|uniref:Uncharacterized protein n=1 Tax=Caerostris darwini TaxID=1538125 RepID=A0AAV4R699_9ARAC|nr:hypothetical protein CDAR_411801 [Caerostris darwini]